MHSGQALLGLVGVPQASTDGRITEAHRRCATPRPGSPKQEAEGCRGTPPVIARRRRATFGSQAVSDEAIQTEIYSPLDCLGLRPRNDTRPSEEPIGS
ncbi:MAG: hypothetical protein LBT00_09765 [Spirochaetaceae bacterium]|nr:hypothetical protein [Spirochaetaceae bacterium]